MILRDYQIEAINKTGQALRLHKHVVLTAATGCHEPSALILLANGQTKKAKDVAVGDRLIGPDGTARTVLELHSGVDEMFQVSSKKIEPFIVNAGHIFALYRTRKRKNTETSISFCKAKEWNYQNKNFRHLHYLFRPGIAIEFETATSNPANCSAYLLGAYLADGSFGIYKYAKCLSLTKNFESWFQILQTETKYLDGYKVSRVLKNSNPKNATLTVSRKKTETVRTTKHNEWTNTVLNSAEGDIKTVPRWIKYGSVLVRQEYLAGVLDGDGSVHGCNSHDLTLKTKTQVEDIRFIALSLGLCVSKIAEKSVRLAKWESARIYYRIRITGDFSNIPLVEKKITKSRQKENPNIFKPTVKSIGLGNFYGWSVDQDNMYLDGDFICHHNSGKSLIIAGIVQRFLAKNPASRVLILCHQAEILLQNKEKLDSLDIQTSVYCAGLGKKETFGKVILASRDSCATKTSGLIRLRFQLILVDECHLVSTEASSQYQKIFAATQPNYIVGLTGSPYRMNGGVIFGKKKFWEVESYRVTVADLQERGFLCPHVFPKLPSIVNTQGIQSRRGDFLISALEQRSSTPEVVSRCVSEWNRLAGNRKCSIFFCVSVAHAALVRDEIAKYTPHVALVTGETSSKDRERLMTDARAGRVKAICNVGVMTTGIDIPIIDCVVFLRATESVSLMIQMSGRGLRIAEGKQDCLFLDFTGNWQRFGGLDDPLIPAVGTSKKNVTSQAYLDLLSKLGIVEETTPFDPPRKECPKCSERVPNGRRVCDCGHIFINHTSKYADEVSKLRETGWKVGYVNLDTLFMKENINSAGKNVGHCMFSIGVNKFSVYLPFTTVQKHFGFYNQSMFRKLRAAKESGKPLLIAARKKSNAFDEMRLINVRDDQNSDSLCN